MLITNLLVSVYMFLSAFFFNGVTFDFDSFWGIFAILEQKHFVAFMYMGIILCLGVILSFVMVSNLFPDTIVPSLAMTFEPTISSAFVYGAGVQKLPGSLTFFGYILIIPGNMFILLGQWMQKTSEEEKEKREI